MVWVEAEIFPPAVEDLTGALIYEAHTEIMMMGDKRSGSHESDTETVVRSVMRQLLALGIDPTGGNA